MKKGRLLRVDLSTKQLGRVLVFDSLIPFMALLIFYAIVRTSGRTIAIRFLLMILGLLLGILVFAINYIFVFMPLENLKRKMQSWDETHENMGDTEIGQIFSKLAANYQEQMSKEYQMEVLKKQAELTALQSQINPHFLYNTLDSIRGFALIHDVPQIAKMTEALSKLFRCMIANEGKMVTLKEELQSVSNYMVIQQFRFDGRIGYQQRLDDEEMLSYYVPNLIIQPLVENAVVHGLECKEGGGVVTVSGYATQKKLVILVEDNGVGMEQEKLDLLNEELAKMNVKTLKIERTKYRGIALLNINQRIRLHFGTEYGVSIMSTPNVSTTVEIVLPLLVTAEGEN